MDTAIEKILVCLAPSKDKEFRDVADNDYYDIQIRYPVDTNVGTNFGDVLKTQLAEQGIIKEKFGRDVKVISLLLFSISRSMFMTGLFEISLSVLSMHFEHMCIHFLFTLHPDQSTF